MLPTKSVSQLTAQSSEEARFKYHHVFFLFFMAQKLGCQLVPTDEWDHILLWNDQILQRHLPIFFGPFRNGGN